jgi:hypothetical protein
MRCVGLRLRPGLRLCSTGERGLGGVGCVSYVVHASTEIGMGTMIEVVDDESEKVNITGSR